MGQRRQRGQRWVKGALQMEIIALGEPLVEFVRADLPDVGTHYKMGFGGDTSNAVIAAARQGARAGYITAIPGRNDCAIGAAFERDDRDAKCQKVVDDIICAAQTGQHFSFIVAGKNNVRRAYRFEYRRLGLFEGPQLEAEICVV